MNYYKKTVNDTANHVKLKMQIGVLTLKLSENINKIDDLIEVDKNIKKYIADNAEIIEKNRRGLHLMIPQIQSNTKLINNNINKLNSNHNIISINTKKADNNLNLINTNISNISNINDRLSNIDLDLINLRDKSNNNLTNIQSINDRIYNVKYYIDDIYILNIEEEKDIIFSTNIKKI